MTTDTEGRYLDHDALLGYVYEFDCPNCHRTFRSTAPTLSAPTLCHGCYTGTRHRHRGRRGAAHTLPSIRRKYKDMEEGT